jgi:arylsulfatase
MSSAHRAVGAALVLVVASGCATKPPPEPPGALLIVLDAAGARHLSAYGNARPTSPRIDRLAGEATLFERAYAQAPWTLPSVASLLTGRYPPARRQDRLIVSGQTLATRLRGAGVATAAFSENPLVTRGLGFDAGFDVFREYFPKRLHDERPRDYPRVASDATVDDAIAWLRDHRGGPFFAYVHLLPPHCPYPAPPPFGGRFDPDYAGDVRGVPDTLMRINDGQLAVTPRDLEHLRLEYEENLAFADHQVGRLLDAVDALGLRARTLVVVTADHGEAFREHGEMLHTTNLHDELLHVPLVVRFPEGTRTMPRRWPGLVELRDVTATVARRFALAAPPGLVEMVRGTWRPRAVARAWTADGDRTLGAVTTARHKLVVDRRTRRIALYDLSRDPGEQVDLAATERTIVVGLVRALRRGEATSFGRRAQPLDPATVRRLRALGYTGPE